ncbi:PilN domain-containing protein [Erwinia sp.]|uniref:PilN domain-containing protein n=1 Tax=Erwinia citreus TaxID=558 RepID=UPI003C7098B6
MVWVNLLPWRARKRKRARERWALVFSLLVLTVLAAAMPTVGKQALNHQYDSLVRLNKAASHRLEGQMKQMSTLVQEKEGLQRQLAERQQRQHRLDRWRTFVLQLPEVMPDTLWLSAISKNAASLVLSGSCQGISDLEAFRLQVQKLALVAQVKTGQLHRGPQGRLAFTLLIKLRGEGDE